jgi:hypothetical protein
VETHRGDTLEKLNWHTPAELILYAIRKHQSLSVNQAGHPLVDVNLHAALNKWQATIRSS